MKKNAKLVRSIIVIIVILGITVAFLKTMGDRKPALVTPNPATPGTSTTTDIDLSPEVTARQLCFIYNTEDGTSAKLSMDLRGPNVIGEFYWLPAEKDKKIGIFTGTVTPVDPKMMARTAHTFWNVSAEGMQTMEQLDIIFGEGIASPGFGEMKDRGDGVYIYANPKQVDYSLNLSDTDCGDEAMD